MAKATSILVFQIQASALLSALNTNNNGAYKRVTPISANFKKIAINILSEHTVKCYVPVDRIGSSRVVDSQTGTDLLKYVKHIDQSYFLDNLRGLPLEELENMRINVEIFPYKNQDMIELLLESMLFNTLILSDSHSGRMDWNSFEKKLHNALPGGCTVSDFIDSKKYFTPSLLNINPRQLNVSDEKGSSHENK